MEAKKESFRDSISTITEEGLRNWIYPKKPQGRWHTRRVIVAVVMLALFFAFPLIKINGEQFMLFDILDRKFVIFGRPFFPQDFYLLAFLLVTGAVFIVLFTVIYGRVWCGWLCPQTIMMEMVYRKVEYWVEGDRPQQMKLDRMPWNKEKIRKKLTKWFLFWIITLIVTSTMWAYVAGTDYVLNFWKNPFAKPGVLTAYLVFAVIYYFVYAWFREQVCIIVCPYGRLQGVLTDENTILVTYDYKRGEKRGPMRKGQDRAALGLGDCIDCKQCVHVCPTGIDIRNGTQMECINCTACMDACDAVMDAIGKPRGLIRYASKRSIEEGTQEIFTPRVKFYTAILAIILTVFIALLVKRPTVDLKVLRVRGQVFTELPDGNIRNYYNMTLINKTTHPFEDLEIKVLDDEGTALTLVGIDDQKPDLEVREVKQFMAYVDIPKGKRTGKTEITFGVYDQNGKLLDKYKSVFIAPVE